MCRKTKLSVVICPSLPTGCCATPKRCTTETLQRRLKRLRQVARQQTKIHSSCLRHIRQTKTRPCYVHEPQTLPAAQLRSVRSSNNVYAFSDLEPVSSFNRFSVVPTATVCVSHPDHLPAPKAQLPNSVYKTGNQRNAAEQVATVSMNRATPLHATPRHATQRKDTAIS